ncbi:MAG: chemotaxis protein CheW [Gemmatimonadaceae bacterium]
MQALLFMVDARRCAIRLADVSEVVPAVEVTPLPGAPSIVEGVVNVRGDIVPVIALRTRMGQAPRAVQSSEYFIIARARTRRVILRSDTTPEIVTLQVSPDAEASDLGRALAGVVLLADGLALIHDVEDVLAAADDGALEDLLARATAVPS